jgi:hypothetical protein
VRTLLLSVLLLGACMSGDKARDQGGKGAKPPAVTDAAAPTPTATGPALVETIDQAVAAKGKPVRVRGVARREKLGDSIQVEEMTIHCHDVRFPDDRIGQIVDAEGTLVVKGGYAATRGPGGEISQGTEGDDTRWVLDGCTLK